MRVKLVFVFTTRLWLVQTFSLPFSDPAQLGSRSQSSFHTTTIHPPSVRPLTVQAGKCFTTEMNSMRLCCYTWMHFLVARLQRHDFSPEQVAWSFSSHFTPFVLISQFTYCCLWRKGFHPEGRQLQWQGHQKRSDQSCGRSCSLKHSVCTNEV